MSGLGYGGEESFEGGEGLDADVVLDALGVGEGVFVGDPDGAEERDDHVVFMSRLFGESSALGSQEDRTVGLGGGEALALESPDRLDDRDVGHADPAGDVDGACLAGLVDQVGDGLDVVFDDLGSVLLSDSLEVEGLFVGLGAWGGV